MIRPIIRQQVRHAIRPAINSGVGGLTLPKDGLLLHAKAYDADAALILDRVGMVPDSYTAPSSSVTLGDGDTYYVDATGGDNDAAGTSEATAWKTIAKVNASTFSAGDNILFKRGETWREQLTVPSSGTSGSPILFGAYGTGALPSIKPPTPTSGGLSEGFEGTGYENTWSETVGSGSTVDEDFTTTVKTGSQSLRCVSTGANAYTEHELSSEQETTAISFSFYVDAMAGIETIAQAVDSSWGVVWYLRFDGNATTPTINFYLYTGGAETLIGSESCTLDAWHDVEVEYDDVAGTYAWTFDTVAQESGSMSGTHRTGVYALSIGITVYWTDGGTVYYDDVEISSPDLMTGQSNNALFSANAKNYITIDSIAISDSEIPGNANSGYGIQTIDCSGWLVNELVITSCNSAGMVFNNGGSITVRNCTVDRANSGGADSWHEAISFENVNGFVAEGCSVIDCGKEGITAKYNARNGVIRYNTCDGNHRSGIYLDSANNLLVFGNVVSGTTDQYKCGIAISIEDVYNPNEYDLYDIVVACNIVTTSGGGMWVWIEEGAETFADITNLVICNNVIVNNNVHNYGGILLFGSGSSSNFNAGNKIINNIIYDNTTTSGAKCIRDDADYAAGFTISHNFFGADEPSDEVGTNSVVGDPLFTDEINADFTLQSTSPCIGAGTNPFTTTDGDQYDADGWKVYDATLDLVDGHWVDGVDIGAYAHGGGDKYFNHLAVVSGTSWDDFVVTVPADPALVAADTGGVLFTAGVPNELDATDRAAMTGDQFFFHENKGLAVYDAALTGTDLAKADKFFKV